MEPTRCELKTVAARIVGRGTSNGRKWTQSTCLMPASCVYIEPGRGSEWARTKTRTRFAEVRRQVVELCATCPGCAVMLGCEPFQVDVGCVSSGDAVAALGRSLARQTGPKDALS